MYNGDSIGFWYGEKLVIHTNQLSAGVYQRSQPDYSDQTATVEIWYRTDDNTLVTDVWVYDPESLVEPWFSVHGLGKISNDDKYLRIRYWHCKENQNNDVHETIDGASQFTDFTFTDVDDTGDKE